MTRNRSPRVLPVRMPAKREMGTERAVQKPLKHEKNKLSTDSGTTTNSAARTSHANLTHQSDLASVGLADCQQHLLHHRYRLLPRHPGALELRDEPKGVERPVPLARAARLWRGRCELCVLILEERARPKYSSRSK